MLSKTNRLLLAALSVTLASAAMGETVPLPRPRPAPEVATPAIVVPLPRPRPADPAVAPPPVSAAPSSEPIPEPPPEPEPRDYQVACPAVMSGIVTAKVLPPIHENQCGLQTPLSLEAVSANGRSVPLVAPVVTDCGMATALPGWIADVDSYLIAHDNTRIKQVLVGTNYACRNVDNAKIGNLSFHAFADALDVVGFVLEDGRQVTIETGWTGTEAEGSRIVRFARDSACTHFTTVLGPEANALHHDHLHIDLGCHGKNCTARLCE
jgi:hypothetical protein